jgi:adenylate cyclase
VTYKAKRRWQIIRDYCIGWTAAFLFLCVVRGVGTVELSAVQFEFWPSVAFSFVLGPLFGGISGFIQILTEERIYRRMSMQMLILSRTVLAILLLTLMVIAAYVICVWYFDIRIGLLEFAFEAGSFPIYLYILAVDLFMVILRQVNLMLGKNNLNKLLQGKFYTPREEERIFMFLDLQSSTQLAEQLGHIQYSRFIQDCFNDLGVVDQNEAEIYQYVGDQVILTWTLKAGLKNENCLRAYFNFAQRLQHRKAYYEAKYNCLPFFKAGMNSGIVTVTEVGKYKKEIAYHGDTINTAARIQEQCNAFQQGLLISEDLRKHLIGNQYRFQALGNMALKGKKKEVAIYAVMDATLVKELPGTEAAVL